MRFPVRILFSLAIILAVVTAFLWGTSVPSAQGQVPQALSVTVLSSRADMVSGGDALVEIAGRGDLEPSTVTVDGRDVRPAFHLDPVRRSLVGLVDGLRVGPNQLSVHLGDQEATLTLTNFPVTGPIVSGDQLTPFACNTVDAGLGPPLDADCSAPTKVEYFYKSSAGGTGRGQFKPLADPAGARPTDIARATITTGATVPYIVRVESGTIDRAIYRIAVLDDPSSGSQGAWTPGAGWNRRLVFSFGGGCGVHNAQGVNQPADVLTDAVLSRGFAQATSTANVFDQYCNDQLSAEALMMIKEHIIERYGLPAWTVGVGGSGGAIQQLLIAQNFPGLLDGLLPALAFPDAVTIAPSIADCRLLEAYFSRNARAWTAAKRMAVEGHTNGTCAAWDKAFGDVLAARPEVTGIAGRPLDNVGVQYGLKGLNSGAITRAEFLDLNATIGGLDSRGRPQRQRMAADPLALGLAYSTGRVNGAAGQAAVPIIEYRSYNDAASDIHDRVRDFAVRARLVRANGNADNQAIWVYPNGVAGLGPRVSALALDTMSRWLDGLAKDASTAPFAQKVKRAKPAGAADACWDVLGTRIDEPATFDRPGICNALYPSHLNPRLVAGAPMLDDVLKCQLRPVSARDYGVAFTPEDMLRLRLTFPSGVCDYARPGVNQAPLIGTFLVRPSTPPLSIGPLQ